jgi:membrane-bound lytic murein transglycosylase D
LDVENPVTAANHISADEPGGSDVPVISTLSEDEIKDGPETVSDYSSNAVALRAVEKNVTLFSEKIRERFSIWLSRSGQYLELMKKILKERNVPEEIVFLPLIESGFNPYAYSPARAAGYWQFIASTGYKFGLKRDDWIDERLDPEKSTKAAIAYLQELHRMLGDWTTVLAAYNSGEENVLRVIGGQKINYLDNFWDLYERLPLETARYVPRFLATLHILKNSEQYGFDLGETEEPFSFEVVTIEKQVRLDAIAKELGISEALLSDLNPELRLKVTPRTSYSLRIPLAMSKVLFARLNSIPEVSHVRTTEISPRLSFVYHCVGKGETLSSIARRYKTTVTAISKANNITDRQLIKIGLRLKIPLSVSKRR